MGVLQRVTETTNTVKLSDRMWARLLASTNQPSFLKGMHEKEKEKEKEKVDKGSIDIIDSMKITSI